MTTANHSTSTEPLTCEPATPQLLLQSAPFQLARQLTPALSGLQFGIGGSLLLMELGLLTKARDLDLVCSLKDFSLIAAALGHVLTPIEVAPHPEYQSEAFARFVATDGTEVDLMAGIRVKQHQQQCWQFRPEQVEWRHQLPWMTALDWLELYQLFNRSERVLLLQTFLQQRK
ncbi:hypothetical protein [Rheinheimera sp.]|uniref:hypothetical protein n=1 Tax=Rheinheimera sp. TaxID=1869214 RepID=UPI0027B967F3|nr:hypothetical protein [Rheinheimera sp.]